MKIVYIVIFILVILSTTTTNNISAQSDSFTDDFELEDYFLNGNDFFDDGDFYKALKSYNDALKINPTDKDVLYNRGLTFEELGRYQEAIQDFNRVIGAEQKDIDVMLSKSQVLEKLGETQKAQFFYEKILELDPENKDALNLVENSIKSNLIENSEIPFQTFFLLLGIFVLFCIVTYVVKIIIYFDPRKPLKKDSPKMNPDSSQVDYKVQAEQSKSILKMGSEERKKRIKERAEIIEKNTLKKIADENLDGRNP